MEVGVLLVGAAPVIRRTFPGQAGRNCIVAVIRQLGVGDEEVDPLVQNGLQCLFKGQAARACLGLVAVRLDNIVELCQTLSCPVLVTGPAVGTRVSVNRLLDVSHIVEGRNAARILLVCAHPAVGAAACERTFDRGQPEVHFHLTLQRSFIVLFSALSLHVQAAVEQTVSSQRVLIELVCVRAADLPCPCAVSSAAPCGVPGHQIVLALVAGAAGRICLHALAADCLVVLVVHVVTAEVTHHTGLIGNAVGNVPAVCCVCSLDRTVFCVRRVRVGPGLRSGLLECELHALGLVAVLQGFDGRMRNGLEAGLLVAALEGVDKCEITLLAACGTAEAVPVINVSQPVQQILSALRLICGNELGVERVLTGVGLGALGRILLDVVRMLSRNLCAQFSLLEEAGLLILFRDHLLENLPLLVELTAAAGELVMHCCDPDDVGHSLGSGFVTVVRSLADQLFNGVIRNAVLAQVAVLLTVGDDIVVHSQEAVLVGCIFTGDIVLLSLGTRALRRCRDGHQRGGCRCSCEDSSKDRSAFLELHCFFPSRKIWIFLLLDPHGQPAKQKNRLCEMPKRFRSSPCMICLRIPDPVSALSTLPACAGPGIRSI